MQRASLGLLLSLVASPGVAATANVPYVPTPQLVVERMLEMAKVGPADYLIDLGSGDGRIVVTAAKKFGARGFGVDVNPERIRESNENAREAGVTDRVTFQQRDLFQADLSDATVITMYLLPRVNLDLRPKLLQLKPGTRIVSHDFSMDDWKADETANLEIPSKWGREPGQSTVYLWIVPAKAAGRWQWQMVVGGKPQAYELTLDQRYQMISGTVRAGERTAKVQKASLRGEEIRLQFTVDVNGEPIGHQLVGRVSGNSIIGSAQVSGRRVQGQLEWQAERAARVGMVNEERVAVGIH
jgi:SAM-dependent methyltransferase